MKERREMIEPGIELSMRRQCELLKVSRSDLYYQEQPPDAEELELMRQMDELHMNHPFYGSRKLCEVLKRKGYDVNRKRIQRLMRIMGLESMAPKPNTTTPRKEHVKYPYLLRKLDIIRPNQVWAADITYIPMRHGFAYLVATIDWFSRRVLSWRLSNSMDPSFCCQALEEALASFPAPEIFNTDQGSQFTSTDFTSVLLDRGVKVSMDGKGHT